MSLDVSLIVKEPIHKSGTGVFVRENGSIKELTVEEIKEKFPNYEPTPQEFETTCVFDANITHNLGEMADMAGIYEACWRPYMLHDEYDSNFNQTEERKFEKSHPMQAKDIIHYLKEGVKKLKERPEVYKQFDSPNGWGKYENFLPWVENYLKACIEYPEAIIEVDR